MRRQGQARRKGVREVNAYRVQEAAVGLSVASEVKHAGRAAVEAARGIDLIRRGGISSRGNELRGGGDEVRGCVVAVLMEGGTVLGGRGEEESDQLKGGRPSRRVCGDQGNMIRG